MLNVSWVKPQVGTIDKGVFEIIGGLICKLQKPERTFSLLVLFPLIADS